MTESEETKEEMVLNTLPGMVVYVLNQAEDKTIDSQKEIARRIAEEEVSRGVMDVDEERWRPFLGETNQNKEQAILLAREKQLVPSISKAINRLNTLDIIQKERGKTAYIRLKMPYLDAIEEISKYNMSSVEGGTSQKGGYSGTPGTPLPLPGSSGGVGLEAARRKLMKKYNWSFTPPSRKGVKVDVKEMEMKIPREQFFTQIRDEHFGNALMGIDVAVNEALVALAAGRDICLYGQPGTGKTTLMEWLALAFGMDIEIHSVDPSWTPSKITAGMSPDALVDPINGIVPGVFMDAIGKEDTWLGLDEMNRGDVSVFSAPLMRVISERRIKVPILSDMDIYVPPNFRLICSINVGDEGTKRMPSAWRRRFAFIHVPSPPKSVEIKLLLTGKGDFKGLTSMAVKDSQWNPDDFLRMLLKFAWATRLDESLRAGLSTGSLLNICKVMTVGMNEGFFPNTYEGVQDAFAHAFLTEVPYQMGSEGNTEDYMQLAKSLNDSGMSVFSHSMTVINRSIGMMTRQPGGITTEESQTVRERI